MTSTSIGRPWRARRALYAAATVIFAFVLVVGPPRPGFPLLMGLLVVGLSIGAPHRFESAPRPGLLAAVGGYDVGVAVFLGALGLQYSALLVMLGAISAIALLLPAYIRWVVGGAAAAGATLAFVTFGVAGVPSVVPPEVTNETVALFLPVATLAALMGGLAWLFGSIGQKFEGFARAQEQIRLQLDMRQAPTLVVEDGTIVHANPAAIMLMGGGLRGLAIRDILGSEPAPDTEVSTILASAGSGSLSVTVRAEFITFEGRPCTALTITDLVDLVDDRTVEPSLPRRLDLLFDRIPVALYRSAPSGEVLAANRALADMLGLSDPSDLLGTVERAQMHYRNRTGRAEWLALFADRDVVLDHEIALTKADGTRIVVTDSARAVRDRDGQILFFEGVMVDVTARREAEESRRRTSEILEATSDLVWLTDETDRIWRVNASMRRFLEDDDDGTPVIGMHVAEFISDTAEAAALADWRADRSIPTEWRGEIVLRSRSGREILASTVAQRHAGFIAIVARDITEERRTARQLEELVAAKDEFIASVSHELRTPLTAVVGLASELAEYYDDLTDATKRDFIRLVSDQATEVAAIVEDLLVAARADTDSITLIHESVDLRRAVEAVVAALPNDVRDRFEIAGHGVACGDAQRIRQVIRNLATNAVRYGELPGVITIEAVGETVAVRVADKGPGIDPAMVERIFRPYERAHAPVSQPSSVGLGLSVSRWLAEKMGGSLVYENAEMSTFVLQLPATRCA